MLHIVSGQLKGNGHNIQSYFYIQSFPKLQGLLVYIQCDVSLEAVVFTWFICESRTLGCVGRVGYRTINPTPQFSRLDT